LCPHSHNKRRQGFPAFLSLPALERQDMNRLFVVIVTATILVLSLLAVGNAWGQIQYTVTDLGTLPGLLKSSASSINNNGQVVGVAWTNGSNDQRAFIFNNGIMQDIGTLPGGKCCIAYDINNMGQVVGGTWLNGNNEHAFLYSNGNMQDLGTLGGGWSRACAINDIGQIVGGAYTSSGYEHAFLYSGGTMRDLGTFGGSLSQANGINNGGKVVGGAYLPGDGANHAFIYNAGSKQDLGTLSGSDSSSAYAINNSGQVVGTSFWGYEYWDAFLYSDGKMKDILANSVANDVNNLGQVVGGFGSPSHAFIYSGTTVCDLNNVIGSGWTLTTASAINDNGQIVGKGINSSGQTHAFLLNPVPEPSTIILLCMCGLGLLAYAWRWLRQIYRLVFGLLEFFKAIPFKFPVMLCLVVLISQAHAIGAQIAYEAFDYSPEIPLNTCNGGTGFVNSWFVDQYTYATTPGSLTDPTGILPTIGNSLHHTGLLPRAKRNLNSTLGTAGTTLYLSFLLRQDAVGDFLHDNHDFGGLILGGTNTVSEFGDGGLFIGVGQDTTRHYGLGEAAVTASGVNANDPVVSGQTALLAVRIDFLSGLDRATLYVNPTPGQSEPLSGLVYTGVDLGQFTQIAITGGNNANWTTDEIRLATTWQEVAVPEPSSLVLLGMGVIGLLAYVWRCRKQCF
jgi:probable HAF family extracellular repeat protein